MSIQSAHSSLLPFMFVFLINLMMIAFCLRSIVPGTPLLEVLLKRKKRPCSISRWYLLSWLCFQFSFQGYYHWFPSLMKINFNFTHAQLAAFYTSLGCFIFFVSFSWFVYSLKKKIHRFVVMLSMPVMGFFFCCDGFMSVTRFDLSCVGSLYVGGVILLTLLEGIFKLCWCSFLIEFVCINDHINLSLRCCIDGGIRCLCCFFNAAFVRAIWGGYDLWCCFLLPL